MSMSTASEPLPYIHSVKPSDVLPALAICPTVRAGDCSSTDVEAALCSCHVMPPRKARRRNDEGGKSKKITAAPSKKLSEATPSRDRNEARKFRRKTIRPLVVCCPSRDWEGAVGVVAPLRSRCCWITRFCLITLCL